MDQRTLLGRLLSPAGFGLVLLLFLLPFVAVSCGPDDQHQVTAAFTGMDMVVAGQPDITGPGVTPDEAADLNDLFATQYDSEPLAILAVLVLIGAMATALVRPRVTRFAAGAGLAVLAAALVLAAELRAVARLEDVRLPSDSEGPTDLQPGVARPQVGFYLAVLVLVALVAGHIVAVARARRGAAVAGSGTAGPLEVDQPPDPPPSGGFLPGGLGGDDAETERVPGDRHSHH